MPSLAIGLVELALAFVLWPFVFMFAILGHAWLAVQQLLRSGRSRSPPPKSVFITGGTAGIGEALALEYAKSGGSRMAIALSGRNVQRLQTVAEACRKLGALVQTRAIDVTDADAMRRFLEEFDAEHPIDLVIANAGVTENTIGAKSDIVRATREVFAINVDGVFNTVLPLIERMRARRSGQIAIVASVAGFGPLTGNVAYSASKAAVRVWGQGLRRTLDRDGVRVNVICPGFVETAMTSHNERSAMPFLVDTPTAVHAIVSGLARDEPLIAFPTPMYLASSLLQLALPLPVQELVARLRLLPFTTYLRPSRRGAQAPAAQ